MVALLGVALSLVGIWHLCAINEKRRRVFRLPPVRRQTHPEAARIALFGPGFAFALGGDAAGFAIWLGGVSAFGWALVALPPAFWDNSRIWVGQRLSQARHWLRAIR